MSQATLPTAGTTAPSGRHPVQGRSRDKKARLLAAARTLISAQGFETVRMADIVAEAGCAIGTAYYLFGNKEGLFRALREDFIATMRANIDGLDAVAAATEPLPLRLVVAKIVSQTLAQVRANAGLLRANLARSAAAPEEWSDFRDLVRLLQTRLADLLETRFTQAGIADPRLKIGFTLQVVFAMCANALLNDPGPLSLDDPAFETELIDVAQRYLERT